MRAVQFSAYGGPEVLHLGEAPEPHAGPGHVRIRVAAAAVNPMDHKLRSGQFAGGTPLASPQIPGFDGAGVVDEVGDGVTGVALGDRVFGQGSAVTAEFAVLREFAHLRPGMTFPEAAALPTVAETAARVLDLLGLTAGQVVVVDGAAGGVGTALVQLAVSRGLAVIGTASAANHDYLRGFGVTPTTYGPGLVDRVRALTREPIAGAADLSGRGSVPELIELTGDPVRVVSIADFSAGELGAIVTDGSAGRVFYALDEVADLVAAGRFTVVLDEVLPWTQAARAHELIEAGHTRGKIVLVPVPVTHG